MEQLRASIVQHHAAAALRAQLVRKDIPQARFAREFEGNAERLNRVLNGAAVMQIHDLGNAATLGGNGLPRPDLVAMSVSRYGMVTPRKPPPGPPLPGHFAGFETGRSETEYVVNVPREQARTVEQVNTEQRVAAALEPVLRDYLTSEWPEAAAAHPMQIEANVVGFYLLGGLAFIGDEGIDCCICVDADWDTRVLAPGYAVVGGAFIAQIRATDKQGRPTEAVAMRRVTDLGEFCLVTCDVTIAWDADGSPELTWGPIDDPIYRPVDGPWPRRSE